MFVSAYLCMGSIGPHVYTCVYPYVKKEQYFCTFRAASYSSGQPVDSLRDGLLLVVHQAGNGTPVALRKDGVQVCFVLHFSLRAGWI